MKKILSTLFIICILGVNSIIAQQPGDWQLIWSDEFEDTLVDNNNWSRIPRWTPQWQCHMSNYDTLCSIRDGILTLWAMEDPRTKDDTTAFITGGIWSKDKVVFEEGRLEICAKIDHATGFWPAIWMLPQVEPLKWPTTGEIDIMEHLNHDNKIHHTVHSNYTKNLKKIKHPKSHILASINPNEFNVYVVERYIDKLIFFINDVKTFEYRRINTRHEGQFPFTDNPFYLILSAQLGGDWVGEISVDQLPAAMQIDYVRYFKAVKDEHNSQIYSSKKAFRKAQRKAKRAK